MGKHGNFDIEVVMKEGAIERINVLESNETLGLGDVAMDTMSKLIVDNQTLNVDAVSGASLTSMAFISAVSDAIDASGAKASEWKKRDHAAVAVDDKMPTEADLIVVGSGGAGFTAAITAARAGKKVIFLEKLGVRGGSTALSGGEMAFVAIALYFAIIKVRPTPFCVMDEIEAALDEANVIRYAEYMRRVSDKTQFIVITHRRGTMEEANHLYGVTMQEKGVSKVIALDLAEAQKTIEAAKR